MKFTLSERKLHQNNYNPPCNVYQQPLIKSSSNKILTGSLAPPSSVLSMINKNTFGYSSRFPQQNHSNSLKNLGPGTYEHQAIIKKKLLNDEKDKSKIIKGKFIQSGGTPSIPFSYYGQNPDEEQIQYVRQLQMNTNLIQSYKKTSKTPVNYTFTKSANNHTYIKAPTSIQQQQLIENDEQKKIAELQRLQKQERDQQNRNKGIMWQQKLKKSNNKRLQIIQSISPDYIPSLQLIEIMKKRRNKDNPGPGDYNIDSSTQQFIATRAKKSKQNEGIQQNTGQQEYQYEYYQVKNHQKGISFTTGKRFQQYQKKSWNTIGPGQYKIKESVIQNKSSQRYSFAKSDRKVFQPTSEGQFRFYIDANYGSQIAQQTNKDEKNKKIPYRSCLSQKPQNGIHLIPRNRSDSCPFGSSSVRFSAPKLEGESQLTLQQQRQAKNKQKLNKMIRTRVLLHKKLATDKNQKEEGLLGLSTMASTID